MTEAKPTMTVEQAVSVVVSASWMAEDADDARNLAAVASLLREMRGRIEAQRDTLRRVERWATEKPFAQERMTDILPAIRQHLWGEK